MPMDGGSLYLVIFSATFFLLVSPHYIYVVENRALEVRLHDVLFLPLFSLLFFWEMAHFPFNKSLLLITGSKKP